MPGGGPVFGAPDVAGFFCRVGAEDGVEKQIDRDVVHVLHVPLETLAIAAVGVFKHRHLAFAIATHDGEGILQGQGRKIHRREFVNAVFGQVAARLGVDQLALDDVVAFGVGIKKIGADAHFIQARHGSGAHLVDFFHLRNAFGQRFADGGLLGGSGETQGESGRGQQGGNQLHRVLVQWCRCGCLCSHQIQWVPMAWRAIHSFRGPLRSKPFMPQLRSACHGPSVRAKSCCRLSVASPMGSMSALRSRS